MSSPAPTLVDLLGDTRAAIVTRLRTGNASVSELAEALELSEVAIRRQLAILERDGLVTATTQRRPGPGRPGARYRLTPRADRLFADRSADFAGDLLDYLGETQGRQGLLAFMRWRQEAQTDRYAAALAGAEDVGERSERLAELLSQDGFQADADGVGEDGRLRLTQGHCAIKEIARAHPEVCTFEAAMFRQLLGTKVSRRETIAGGADACVCHVSTTI
ncbi:MAG: helix-turn-helix transcriptional regulator [Egibacteraceae bacterium]